MFRSSIHPVLLLWFFFVSGALNAARNCERFFPFWDALPVAKLESLHPDYQDLYHSIANCGPFGCFVGSSKDSKKFEIAGLMTFEGKNNDILNFTIQRLLTERLRPDVAPELAENMEFTIRSSHLNIKLLRIFSVIKLGLHDYLVRHPQIRQLRVMSFMVINPALFGLIQRLGFRASLTRGSFWALCRLGSPVAFGLYMQSSVQEMCAGQASFWHVPSLLGGLAATTFLFKLGYFVKKRWLYLDLPVDRLLSKPQ